MLMSVSCLLELRLLISDYEGQQNFEKQSLDNDSRREVDSKVR